MGDGMTRANRNHGAPWRLCLRRPASARSPRRGVALLVVLLVTAILTVVVLDFAQSSRIDFYIASNIQNGMRAYYMAKSGVQVAEGALLKDIQDNEEDHFGEEWNNPLYSNIPLSDTELISVEITDESGKFNLNHLVTVAGRVNEFNLDVFRQLLVEYDIDAKIGDAIVDWIDEDTDALSGGGVEEQFYGYSAMVPAGITPKNGHFASLAELRMVAGVTDDVFQKLSETCTIYSDHKYNINTIDEKVLRALIVRTMENANVDDTVTKILSNREGGEGDDEKYFNKTNLRKQMMDVGVDPQLAGRLAQRMATKSRYFSVDVTANVGATVKNVHAVIQRSKQKVKLIYFRPGELLKSPRAPEGAEAAAAAAGVGAGAGAGGLGSLLGQ